MSTTTQSVPLGATVSDGRVHFAVWAPFADRVEVVTDDGASDLGCTDDGVWSGSLEGRSGLEYVYRITKDDDTFERIDPRARMVTNSVGRSVAIDTSFDWPDAGYEPPTIDGFVIYELHPGTFGGDLDGVTDRLAHVADRGFTAVELMPVGEFAGDVSWGYNPAFPFAVESAYGGPDALKRLVASAHELGMAVILDVVYNHFGPSDLDMWRFDGWSENDGGGIYFYNDHRAATPWGHTRPDYGRPEVRRFIVDNARMWFDEYRIDGLRLDSTVNMRTVDGAEGGEEIPEGWQVLQEIAAMRDSEFPGRILIAEDLQENEWITKPIDEGGAGFDAQWDAGFVHPVRALLEAIEDDERSVESLARVVAGPDHRDGWGRVVYTESHDEVANGRTRVVSEIDGEDPDAWYARGRALCGLVAVLTARGIPMTFQGQEWLEDDYFRDDTPLDWDEAESGDDAVEQITRLVQLRSGRVEGARGLRGSGIEVVSISTDDNLISYRRWRDGGAGDEVLVVMNLSSDSRHYEVRHPTVGRWEPAVSTDPASEFGESADMRTAHLAGYSAAVFLLS